jgi:hypothetical protein
MPGDIYGYTNIPPRLSSGDSSPAQEVERSPGRKVEDVVKEYTDRKNAERAEALKNTEQAVRVLQAAEHLCMWAGWARHYADMTGDTRILSSLEVLKKELENLLGGEIPEYT